MIAFHPTGLDQLSRNEMPNMTQREPNKAVRTRHTGSDYKSTLFRV